MASLWGGRFEKDMDDIVKRYNASIFLIRECTTRILTAVSLM